MRGPGCAVTTVFRSEVWGLPLPKILCLPGCVAAHSILLPPPSLRKRVPGPGEDIDVQVGPVGFPIQLLAIQEDEIHLGPSQPSTARWHRTWSCQETSHHHLKHLRFSRGPAVAGHKLAEGKGALVGEQDDDIRGFSLHLVEQNSAAVSTFLFVCIAQRSSLDSFEALESPN